MLSFAEGQKVFPKRQLEYFSFTPGGKCEIPLRAIFLNTNSVYFAVILK